jgi:hypothetical protein
MVDQILMGYYWDGRDNYVIYSDEDGYTTMKKEKEDETRPTNKEKKS